MTQFQNNFDTSSFAMYQDSEMQYLNEKEWHILNQLRSRSEMTEDVKTSNYFYFNERVNVSLMGI